MDSAVVTHSTAVVIAVVTLRHFNFGLIGFKAKRATTIKIIVIKFYC
jgi:hypothetical protein